MLLPFIAVHLLLGPDFDCWQDFIIFFTLDGVHTVVLVNRVIFVSLRPSLSSLFVLSFRYQIGGVIRVPYRRKEIVVHSGGSNPTWCEVRHLPILFDIRCVPPMTASAAANLGEPGVSHLVLSHIVTLIIASVTFFTYELVHFWHQKLVVAIRLSSNAFLWSRLIFRGPTTIFVVEFLGFHVQAVLEFLRDLSFAPRFLLRHVVESIFVVLILLLDTRFVHPGWLGALACLLLIAISVLNIRDHALLRSVIHI